MLAHLLLFGKVVAVVFRQTWVLFRLRIASMVHRLTYRPGAQPKNIVVVGASFAGYHTARCLVNSIPSGYRVVVIEKNSHFQLTWVLPRFCVVAGHDNKPFIPYGAYLKGPPGSSLWVTDTVGNIEPGKDGHGRVQTAAGEWIDYEYLVLATGSSAGLPSRVCAETKSDGMKALYNQRQKLAAAHDIVVMGGGPAGIELAADAKAQFPRKNVTLIHSRKTLLNDGFGVKLHRAILKEMENLGVKLVPGEKPAIPDGETGDITLNEGSVHFDCLIRCTGQRPNSSMMHFLDSSAFSASGHIRVKPSLQVADDAFHCIYAAGDVIDGGAFKNARSSFEQGQTVAQNIVRSIKGQQQIEYRQKWWEGTTKLTLGLAKSVVYIADGRAEWVISSGQKVELDSPRVWKYLGVTPYVDDTGN
ncbi:uncharacterized protein N7498_004384 [Penicillium cinerascens]|uniref:FAD/NAD(P)-binding domain-containing protein n=1 Tax=Penicillium cinerascens TaxID=70096 RepID=A0A9W9N4Y4_9EURO|nr:uncharacterized protein N7498_004384 [Penicillium cinerascens]KAJ5212738.1 hypothetical protein N7498_004384 [Penicillium cinerascens]